MSALALYLVLGLVCVACFDPETSKRIRVVARAWRVKRLRIEREHLRLDQEPVSAHRGCHNDPTPEDRLRWAVRASGYNLSDLQPRNDSLTACKYCGIENPALLFLQKAGAVWPAGDKPSVDCQCLTRGGIRGKDPRPSTHLTKSL